MSRTIRPQELKQLLESGDKPLILDVRRRADFESDRSVLPDAQRRDPEEVATWAPDLPHDREIVIYCAHGRSVSNSILDHLLGQGLSARFVEGGLDAWKSSGGETS